MYPRGTKISNNLYKPFEQHPKLSTVRKWDIWDNQKMYFRHYKLIINQSIRDVAKQYKLLVGPETT